MSESSEAVAYQPFALISRTDATGWIKPFAFPLVFLFMLLFSICYSIINIHRNTEVQEISLAT